MANLTTKTQHLCIVIRLNKLVPKALINSYCSTWLKEYSYILHDKDVNKDGEKIFPHWHIVGNATDMSRLSTHLNRLVKHLDLSSGIGIEIDKYNSYIGALQYLIHKNDKDKFQYELKEVISSLEEGELETIMQAQNDCITFDRLYEIVSHAQSKCEIMKEIGLNYYQHYRATIIDMWNELNEINR